MQTKRAECGRAPLLLGMPFGFIDMNIMQAYHDLTRIAVQTHGGCAADYNNPDHIHSVQDAASKLGAGEWLMIEFSQTNESN